MGLWVITGADRGIGQAMCRLLHQRGQAVLAACLGIESPLTSEGIETCCSMDVTGATSIARLDTQIGNRTVHALVNNAGRVIEKPLGKLDADSLLAEYAVNAIAPVLLTQTLMPKLSAGSRIAIITSRVGSLSENGSGGLYGYRMSKAAANMAGINLSHDLKRKNIAVICLHPGSVRTQMTAGLSDMSTVGNLLEPEDSARGLIARIDALNIENTGAFLHANGEVLSW